MEARLCATARQENYWNEKYQLILIIEDLEKRYRKLI
jgi:hypothetical protein